MYRVAQNLRTCNDSILCTSRLAFVCNNGETCSVVVRYHRASSRVSLGSRGGGAFEQNHNSFEDIFIVKIKNKLKNIKKPNKAVFATRRQEERNIKIKRAFHKDY